MTTPTEITAAVHEAERLISPARLANVPTNTFAVMAFITGKALAPEKPESYIAAFKALYNSLEWVVKPAKLLADEKNNENKPAAVENQRKAEEARQATVKAAEQKAKTEKEIAKLVKQCEDLIDSYHPLKKNGKLDYPERDSSVAKWKASLAEAKKSSVEYMRSYTKSLVATVAKRYADQERASERL